MKKINSDTKYLILLWGLLIAILIGTFTHHGNLLVDCGREAYYSLQVAQGKVLYKDIFNIYGPFSYMYNALLFKIFGVNLNVLFLSGCVSSFFIASLTYLIARRFLDEFLSFSISAFAIMVGVLNTNIFNTIFPYSFGMLYGTVAVLASIWLLLKYEETSNLPMPPTSALPLSKTILNRFRSAESLKGGGRPILYLYLSAFFAGLCVANKYEFLPYFLVIAYAAFKIKPLNFKQYSLTALSLIFIPAVCFAILSLQGMRLQDLISTALIINKMAHTQTLSYFYQHTGVFFHEKTLFFLTGKFFNSAFPLFLLFFTTKIKDKFASIIPAVIAIWLIFHNTDIAVFAFLPLLISIWFVLNIKKINNNTKLMILTLSSILLCAKIYWALLVMSYGTYLVSLPLITISALISEKFKDRKINPLIIPSYLILVTISLSLVFTHDLAKKTEYISTPRGKLYIEKSLHPSADKLIKYLQTNTKKTDNVMIFPEGQLINFLTERKSDDVYGSLIPLYVETFGENKIIEHFKQAKPEYIIFNNWNYHEYYYKYICNDYAQSFCAFVAQNYTQEKVIDDGFRYLIFKLKNK